MQATWSTPSTVQSPANAPIGRSTALTCCNTRPAPIMQIPTIGFIYFAGWLGYAGSKYLQIVKEGAKPIEKEIIIGEPRARAPPPPHHTHTHW